MASQKRISVKDGDEAKEQFSKVINLETVMKKSSAILTSLQIDQTLFIWNCFFIFSSLENVCHNFHGQSAVACGFNTNADMVTDN